MHRGAIPSSVTKLVLAFGHRLNSASFDAIHDDYIFLAELNLSAVQSITHFIATFCANESVTVF